MLTPILFALLSSLAHAQVPTVECSSHSGTSDDGVTYSHSFSLRVYRQHTSDAPRYFVVTEELQRESGRVSSEEHEVREGDATLTFTPGLDTVVDIALDPRTPARADDDIFSLYVHINEGFASGFIVNTALLEKCVSNGRDEHSCRHDLGRRLDCRVRRSRAL